MGLSATYNVRAACQILGYSRQTYYHGLTSKEDIEAPMLECIDEYARKERQGCPTRGCRTMYDHFGKDLPIGRDKTIKVLQGLGYRVRYPKRYGRSTQSGTRPFENLLVNKKVDGINQVWQADMAHYLYGDRKYYTMYITDVYSQEVIGYGAYSSAHAINFTEVLRMAVSKGKQYIGPLDGLIHHSDGGKQYESEVYQTVCKRNGMDQSMCMYSYENPYAEKTNDLINNQYLNVWRPKSLKDIRKCQRLAVLDHNQKARKKTLGKLAPQEFRLRLMNDTINDKAYTLELKPKYPEPIRLKQIK